MELYHPWWNSPPRWRQRRVCSIAAAFSHSSLAIFSLVAWRVKGFSAWSYLPVIPIQYTLIDKLNINVGRIREVVEAPDGSIYFTTSNRDGRGQLRPGDDKIYRITPQ